MKRNPFSNWHSDMHHDYRYPKPPNLGLAYSECTNILSIYKERELCLYYVTDANVMLCLSRLHLLITYEEFHSGSLDVGYRFKGVQRVYSNAVWVGRSIYIFFDQQPRWDECVRICGYYIVSWFVSYIFINSDDPLIYIGTVTNKGKYIYIYFS